MYKMYSLYTLSNKNIYEFPNSMYTCEEMKKKKQTQNLVIHTCCADCLLNSIQNLEYRDIINKRTKITLLFYNPNIHPRSEYIERLNAVKKILGKLKETYNLELVIPNYSPKEYIKEILGNFKTSEKRCLACWNVRIKYLFEYAMKNSIPNVTTTLLSSHYQDKERIKTIAKHFEEETNINFVEIDDSSNSKHSGFYKQNYCGCCFSLTEKMVQSNNKLREE